MKVYIIFKSFSSMKCVSVVSVAKHGIISTLMFQIDFFFQMGFFRRYCWPPKNQLCIRAVQSATWKVNLQGAITVHAARKQCPYHKCHSPYCLWSTYSRSPLCFFQSNHPRALDPFILTIWPWFPPALHFCSWLLDIGQSDRGLTRTMAWYWLSVET